MFNTMKCSFSNKIEKDKAVGEQWMYNSFLVVGGDC